VAGDVDGTPIAEHLAAAALDAQGPSFQHPAAARHAPTRRGLAAPRQLFAGPAGVVIQM
jgi:hypothetical protein